MSEVISQRVKKLIDCPMSPIKVTTKMSTLRAGVLGYHQSRAKQHSKQRRRMAMIHASVRFSNGSDDMYDVIVAGGGPAGLASAHGMLRARPDLKIKVIERRVNLDPIGAGLVLYPNSLRSLQCVSPEAKDDIIAHAAEVTNTKILDKRLRQDEKSNSQEESDLNDNNNQNEGRAKELTVRNAAWDTIKAKVIYQLKLAPLRHTANYRDDDLLVEIVYTYISHELYDDFAMQYGEQPCVTSWHKCVSALATRLPSGVLELGCQVTQYSVLNQGAMLDCENQIETDNYGTESKIVKLEYVDSTGIPKTIYSKILVGADGYFSKVRDSLLQDGKPTYAGSVIWRALISSSSSVVPENTSVLYPGDGIYFIYYPTGENVGCWTVSKLISEDDFLSKSTGNDNSDNDESYLPSSIQSDPRAVPRSIGEGAFQEALAHLKDCLPKEYIEMVMNTDHTTVTRHGTYIRDPFSEDVLWKMSDGPVTVLGDAAHPMRPVGQGNAMALEDAAELASCIQIHGVTESALRSYEARRIPRVRLVAQKSQLEAMKSYGRASEMKLDPLPAYDRVNNYCEEMDYDDWLYDIQFPVLDAALTTM